MRLMRVTYIKDGIKREVGYNVSTKEEAKDLCIKHFGEDTIIEDIRMIRYDTRRFYHGEIVGQWDMPYNYGSGHKM